MIISLNMYFIIIKIQIIFYHLVHQRDRQVYLRAWETPDVHTKIAYNNLDPVFEERFQFIVNDYASQVLHFDVFDAGVTTSTPLGNGQLNLALNCPPGLKKRVTVPLEDGSGGSITVGLEYRPFVTAPADRTATAVKWHSASNEHTLGYLFATVVSCSDLKVHKTVQVHLVLHDTNTSKGKRKDFLVHDTWSMVPTSEGEVVWNQTFAMAIRTLAGLQLKIRMSGLPEVGGVISPHLPSRITR